MCSAWWDIQQKGRINLSLTSPVHGRFVFCRQRQDDRLQRGAEQQSVVLLSAFPYSSVLAPLCQYAGPLYFNRGAGALQEVVACLRCHRPSSSIRPCSCQGRSMTSPDKRLPAIEYRCTARCWNGHRPAMECAVQSEWVAVGC